MRTLLLAALLLPTLVRAQTNDHLKCYKIKDPQTKTSYTADLGGLVAEPGCTIKVPAQMACVPATKTNVTPTPTGQGAPGTPNEFFCYKVRCPRVTLPTLDGVDQFGSRTVTPSTAKLLCAPAVPLPRFVDNGDGTVTDRQTRLQWEKKTGTVGDPNDLNDPHNVNNTYTWSSSGTGAAADGTAYADFLSRLNLCISVDAVALQEPGFAGHCDWRLPTVVELRTILLASAPGCGSGSPCIDPVFGATQPAATWSSTLEFALFGPFDAWYVNFDFAASSVNGTLKTSLLFVRAVRTAS